MICWHTSHRMETQQCRWNDLRKWRKDILKQMTLTWENAVGMKNEHSLTLIWKVHGLGQTEGLTVHGCLAALWGHKRDESAVKTWWLVVQYVWRCETVVCFEIRSIFRVTFDKFQKRPWTKKLQYSPGVKGQERMLKYSEVTGLQQVLDPGPRAELPCTLRWVFFLNFFFKMKNKEVRS